MTAKHLEKFPKPLLEDLVAGRWLPIVGAGLSRNASLPLKQQMPLWNDLGDLLRADLRDFEPASALDAISAYEHEYGRPRLIERLSEVLHVNEAAPGNTHIAFCSIQFDIVCTTNFDFLLERQYNLIPRRCTPLIDEEQLGINPKTPGTILLKLHGDLNHPARLIATEADYDRFLHAFPMLATYLASLLITRTAVLVGYSLDDPDFRQIWQVVAERLGRSRRTAWAILVDAKPTEIARYERRGIRVINLAGSKAQYGKILAEAFTELSEHWRNYVIPASQVKEERPLYELSLPTDSPTRLCFFAIPLNLLSFYRERVFPVVSESGLVPLTADDVVSPGDSVIAKIDALISRAYLIIVDVSSETTNNELGLALARKNFSQVLVISPDGRTLLSPLAKIQSLRRPDIASPDIGEFLRDLRGWLVIAQQAQAPAINDEPERLLKAGEFWAAVVAAITLLESNLRDRFKAQTQSVSRHLSWRDLLDRAEREGKLGSYSQQSVLKWLRVRNEAVHSKRSVSKSEATEIVSGVAVILAGL